MPGGDWGGAGNAHLVQQSMHVEQFAQQTRTRRRRREPKQIGEAQVLLLGDFLGVVAGGGRRGRRVAMRHNERGEEDARGQRLALRRRGCVCVRAHKAERSERERKKEKDREKKR